ncbi:MAG: efflux transporter periplasmic adaptor subunit [Deltaproteobacteria bacterium RIFCSPLOWO2_01_FULL_42_9]|nr:MAG: efflux transporter periplasmic adaptor subunit [Deltaproteobacteria bacterium RIFCSPLOWO2_01_FULL_42_9]
MFRRWMPIVAVAAVVVAAIVYGFIPKPVPVAIAKVSRGQLRVAIEEEGKTRVKDRFVISSSVAGYMRRINLEVGGPVAKGGVIFEIEPLRSSVLDPRSRAEAEAAVSAAEAALNAAQENARSAAAEAGYAIKKFERSKKLYDEGYISKEMFDQIEAEAKQKEANRLSAEAAVNVARFELDKASSTLRYSASEGGENHARVVAIRSPVNGRVLKIHHKSEGVVNAGDAIIDIGDPQTLEVTVEVLSSDAVKIKPGTPMLFERWGGDLPLTGKVRVVEPAAFTKVSSLGVEEQRGLVIADITSIPESWQRLGDSYRVEAGFILWEGKDILQIPASALFRYENGWAVFIFENKLAYLRKVEVGHRNGLAAEIISGLADGDVVITHPDESIKDGARVRVR